MDRLVVGHGLGLTQSLPDPLPHLEPGQRLTTVPRQPPILIGLCSRAMGSGKSEVANHLISVHGFTLVKFAAPLKAMTRALLAETGLTPAEVERHVEGDLKEVEIPALQRSCRYVMQRVGSEFGREMLHRNVWVDIAVQRSSILLAAGKSVVIDDLRFLNELEGIYSLGGHPLRVERSSATVTLTHSSEGELDDLAMLSIENEGTIADLRSSVDMVLNGLTRNSLKS